MTTHTLASAPLTGMKSGTVRQWKNPKEVMKKRKKRLQHSSSSSMGMLRPPSVGVLRPRTQDKENVSPRPVKDACLRPTSRVDSGVGAAFSPLKKATAENGLDLSRPIGQPEIPLDWSLRTKVRFTSPHPFSWASNVRSQQEAEGVARYIQGSPMADCAEEASVLAMQSELQQYLHVWMHPSLPFAKLYPRMETRLTAASSAQPCLMQDGQVLDALKEDWSASFRSVFHSLRSGHCPYFYLCANQFTSLFFSAGVGGCSSVTALLTPTTSGFRQSLKKEGVEFSLPLATCSETAPSSTAQSHGTRGEPLDDGSDNEDESTASCWLQSIGLMTPNQPGIPANQINFQRSRGVSIDDRPESVVCVEGASVQALFNFLLNSKTTVATTGVHAGLPPTLLAPTAFHGSTLTAIKARQGVIQEHLADRLERVHYLDVTGPALPTTVASLCRLLKRTQHGELRVLLSNIDSTVGFNVGPGEARQDSQMESTAQQVAACCGTAFDSYVSSASTLCKQGLHEVICKNDLYTSFR